MKLYAVANSADQAADDALFVLSPFRSAAVSFGLADDPQNRPHLMGVEIGGAVTDRLLAESHRDYMRQVDPDNAATWQVYEVEVGDWRVSTPK